MKSKKEYVTRIFNSIANDYDRMNIILTAGMFPLWQTSIIKKMKLAGGESIIDICCGSGEMTLKISQILQKNKSGQIIGIDLSEKMLEIARKKAVKMGMNVSFEQQDALAMTFQDQSFTHVTNAFALRNVENIVTALTEMYRVLKPGGKAFVMEVSRPSNPIIRFFFSIYYYHIVPLIGRFSDKGQKIDQMYTPYQWLSESLKQFPETKEVQRMFYQSGFSQVSASTYGLGAITLFIAEK